MVSEVIAVPGGYALVLVESRTPGEELTAARRTQIEARLRRRLERLAMNNLADSLLAEAKVVVFDPSLRWSWEHRPK